LARRVSDWALGFMIPKLPFEKGECEGVPLDFCPGFGRSTSPNEVLDFSPDLVAHPRVGVPTGRHVPHG